MESITELREKNSQLEAEKQTLNQTISRLEGEKRDALLKVNALQDKYGKLLAFVQKLKRMTFGKKSEKYHNPGFVQESLFGETFQSQTEIESAPDMVNPAESMTSKEKRKSPESKSQQARKSPNVEVVEISIPVSESDKQCECGRDKVFVGHEEKEYYHYIRATVLVVRQKREIWGCSNSCEGQMVTALTPPHVLPKSGISPAFLAELIVSKMVDRQPWYHQSKNLQRRYGITISRGTMARWAIESSIRFLPLYQLLKHTVFQYQYMGLDATWFNVLKSRHGPGKRSCVWGFKGGAPGKECVLFAYQDDETRRNFLQQFIGPYSGIVICDGEPDYMRLENLIGWVLACCNSHARRKFEPLTKRLRSHGLVHDILDLYTKIYELEALAKEQDLNEAEHTVWRDQKIRPCFEAMHQLMIREVDNVANDSELLRGIRYTLKLWPYLTRCLTDSKIPLDNNALEREIRKFVIGRNNFLFSDTVGGAESLMIYFSLIQTARMHELNERNYLEYLIRQVPLCNPKNPEDFIPLLPWNVDKQMINATKASPTGWD
jgi:transposase